MKISLISTVKDEVNSIDYLFDSIARQTLQPDEVIITDAGSIDGTLNKLLEWEKKLSYVKIIEIKGCGRSEGRNKAIEDSTGEIIAITDFGCVLPRNWLFEITKPIIYNGAEATAGYYLNNDTNIFAKVNSYFTHPALFEIDENLFLPSTRSIAFKKECWEKIGGFNINYIFGEDTLFSSNLRQRFKVIFNEKAAVLWSPGKSIFTMMYKLFNYSKWDGKGGFSKKFYNKKIQLFLLLIVLAWFSAESNVIFYFLLFICGLYSIKTFLRAQKKGLGVSSAVLVVIIKPLLDFCQTAGFINGKITGIK